MTAHMTDPTRGEPRLLRTTERRLRLGPQPLPLRPSICLPNTGAAREAGQPTRRKPHDGRATCTFCGERFLREKRQVHPGDQYCCRSHQVRGTYKKRRSSDGPEHGTYGRYRKGCRCDACRQSNTERCRRPRERSRPPRSVTSRQPRTMGQRHQIVGGPSRSWDPQRCYFFFGLRWLSAEAAAAFSEAVDFGSRSTFDRGGGRGLSCLSHWCQSNHLLADTGGGRCNNLRP